jgi:hypothetical protein
LPASGHSSQEDLDANLPLRPVTVLIQINSWPFEGPAHRILLEDETAGE